VDIVELALQAYGPPVYVHHEIVHNRYVVDQLRQNGAIFVETVEEVSAGGRPRVQRAWSAAYDARRGPAARVARD